MRLRKPNRFQEHDWFHKINHGSVVSFFPCLALGQIRGKIRVVVAMEPGFRQKTSVLRKYERFCYQIAYYLLEEEEEAVVAATNALIELAGNERFFLDPESEQEQIARMAAMKASLAAKRFSVSV